MSPFRQRPPRTPRCPPPCVWPSSATTGMTSTRSCVPWPSRARPRSPRWVSMRRWPACPRRPVRSLTTSISCSPRSRTRRSTPCASIWSLRPRSTWATTATCSRIPARPVSWCAWSARCSTRKSSNISVPSTAWALRPAGSVPCTAAARVRARCRLRSSSLPKTSRLRFAMA